MTSNTTYNVSVVPHEVSVVPHEVIGSRRGLEMVPRRLHGLQYLFFKAKLRLNMSHKPLACLYTFFVIKINNNIPLKMPLNIACFIAVYQPSDILLCSFGAAVADIISGLPIPNAI
jgi:hypothetical protein